METLIIATAAVLCIVAVNTVAPKAGVAAPLVLVVIGVGVSFLPFVPVVNIAPEWILGGILPALLYCTATSLPTMDFRRDFQAIGVLSVLLVVVSAVVLGFFFRWVIPGIDLAIGIALGAIVSPTDAVAVSIVRRLGVAPRVVLMLEGESLLNDASALVLLRSAIAAAATSVSLASVVGNFIYAVVIAVGVGFGVGILAMTVRSRVQPTLGTAVSLAVPFIAYIPAELMHASGLVSVVVAGLVTSYASATHLRPQDRISEQWNWRTVELLLEGAVFLIMGLHLAGLVTEASEAGASLGRTTAIAGAAILGALAVRTVFVASLVRWMAWRLQRAQRREEARGTTAVVVPDAAGPVPQSAPGPAPAGSSVAGSSVAWAGDGPVDAPGRVSAAEGAPTGTEAGAAAEPAGVGSLGKPGRDPHPTKAANPAPVTPPAKKPRRRPMRRLEKSDVRRAADIDYRTRQDVGPREGVLLMWAGMRGVVTLAAAQSLPTTTPQRAVVVLIAFIVAAGSLLLQGGTLPWLVRKLDLVRPLTRTRRDRLVLQQKLDRVAGHFFDALPRRPNGARYDEHVVDRARRDVVREHRSHNRDGRVSAEAFAQYQELRLRAIIEQRATLLRIRRRGIYTSKALSDTLDQLDAEQIDIESRHGPDN